MNLLLQELHSSQGVSEPILRTCLSSIPFHDDMGKALSVATTSGGEVIIISDANTFYIDHILNVKGVRGHISRIITNPATFREDGLLMIEKHTVNPPHGCSRCAVNLCKGKELLSHLSEKPFDRVVYLGDGRNDFCPATKLSE